VLYLHKLPAEQLQAAHEANKKLIASKKFWNLSKHTSALIRNSWFSVLIALCQKAPDLLADDGARAALAVFGILDETDPTVLPTVWEASLHVLTAVQVSFFNVFFSHKRLAHNFFRHRAAQALRSVCYTRAVLLLELTSNNFGCLITCYLQRMYKYLGIEATLEVLIIGFWNVECSYMF
jgi:hypothetical protein